MDNSESVLEAHRLLAIHGPEHLDQVQAVVSHQFQVLQSRSQLLLTLATITLTITGFSGPHIAAASTISAFLMGIGICFVLAAVTMILWGSLRIRWVSQLLDPNRALDSLSEVIAYRDRKTRLYTIELSLLVVGLTCYVVTIITFLLLGGAGVTRPAPSF